MPEILPLAVLHIDAKSLWMYTSEGRVHSANYPEGLVRDFEITAKDKFVQFIGKFIETQGVIQSSIIYVFGDSMCFAKDFTEGILQEKEGQTQAFFDIVPFERVLSRVYPLEKGSRAIGINRDFFQLIRDAFEALGFATFAVIPNYVLVLLGITGSELQIGQIAAKRSDTLKQYTMVRSQIPQPSLQQREESLAQEHTPLILLVFFVFLALIIGFTYYFLTMQAQQARQPKATPVPVRATPSPTPSEVSSPSPSVEPTPVGATSSAVIR